MFESYNMKEFGNYIKEISRNSGLSQSKVSHLTGLSEDTVRRIEQGSVVPRFDTLILLSEAFKVDLIDAIKKHSSSGVLGRYYTRLDHLIMEYSKEALTNLQDDFNQFSKPTYIDPPIAYHTKEQFLLILKAITSYYLDKWEECEELCYEAMSLTNPIFNLENYRELSYTTLEKRILLLISTLAKNKEELYKAIDLLKFLLDSFTINSFSPFQEKLLVIKIINNISYNYHNLSKDEEALHYAEKGIEFCLEYQVHYALSSLLFRKGAAMYYLEKEGYEKPLRAAVVLLNIEGKDELAKTYQEVISNHFEVIF